MASKPHGDSANRTTSQRNHPFLEKDGDEIANNKGELRLLRTYNDLVAVRLEGADRVLTFERQMGISADHFEVPLVHVAVVRTRECNIVKEVDRCHHISVACERTREKETMEETVYTYLGGRRRVS